MRALGNYIMRGRLHAIGVVSVMTMLSLLLPPLTYVLSGAPVGLVSLRRGARIGMQVILGSMVVMALLCYPAGINPLLAPAFAVSVWAPVWLCAVILRLTESQGLLVMAAGALGAVFVVLMHLMVDDVTGWWKSWFDTWVQNHMTPDAASRYHSLLDSAMPMMNAMMASGMVISLVLTVILARWWQAILYNPGGFKAEFYRLRLPRYLAAATFAVAVLSLVDVGLDKGLFRDLLAVLVFLYLFQGVAAVHRTVSARELSSGWLVGMYVLLLLLPPQTALLIACVGMVDSWMGERKSLS
ncbi:MAG: DUF2232 domain-containing protein [Gammaproteobacteria bacterium]|jgi:hypothetical protein